MFFNTESDNKLPHKAQTYIYCIKYETYERLSQQETRNKINQLTTISTHGRASWAQAGLFYYYYYIEKRKKK